MSMVKRGPGRPRKYGRPSRAVTVTLPDDVIARLGAIDADLGQAIVAAVGNHAGARPAALRPAELASYGNHAVIVVTPVTALKRLAGIQLVPIGNNRALISLEPPHSIPQLELDIRDVIERAAVDRLERQTLEAIADILRQARLARDIILKERTIIVLESRPQRRSR